MFVGKSELKNGWNLAGIKLRNIGKTQFYNVIFVLALICINFLPALSAINTPHNLINSIRLHDYSTSFLVIAFIFSIAFAYIYRTFNELYSVYPQTNTSSFLSMQILYYIFVFTIAVVALVAYLLQYFILSWVSMRQENVVLVYKFNWEFVIVGFFVMIMYLMLIVAVVAFVYVVVRKFHLYAALGFGILGVIVMTNSTRSIEVFKRVFGFLIFEKTIGFFLLKALLVWVLLFGLSLVINKSITNYRHYKKKVSFSIAFAVIVIGGFIGIGGFVVMIANYSFNSNATMVNEEVVKDSFEVEEIVIDASKVSPGSEITLNLWNIHPGFYDEIEYNQSSDVSRTMVFDYDSSQSSKLSDFNGKKIIVKYSLPSRLTDNVDIYDYVDSKVTAYLDGNNLHIKYECIENVKAVFLPTWSFMHQFDRYKGKNIHKEIFGSSLSIRQGHVSIEVE